MGTNITPILQQLQSLFQQLTFKVITMENATPSLLDLEKKLKMIPVAEWPSLRLTHISELTQLKWDLEYVLKEPNIRSNNRVLIGFRDRHYNLLFDGIEIINERKLVTNTFNEFVRGITYFTTEPAGTIHAEPVYHRPDSCPPNDKPNMNCTEPHNADTKKKLLKCYIERLIYDELWIQLLSMQQNQAHLLWLSDTQTAFNTCFPNTRISVSIRMIDQHPDNVAITVEDDSGTTTELYSKAYFVVDARYDTQITCLKIVNSQVVAVKTNTCDKEGTWMPTSGGAPTAPGGGSKL